MTACTSDVFGDPVPDLEKYCWCQTWDSNYSYGVTQSAAPSHPTDSIFGGNWELVRHQPALTQWGPATDQLSGSDVFGDSSDDSQPWTVKFDDKDFSEFLFATGDLQVWMVMEKDEVLDWYANQQRSIEASSSNANEHSAAMYRRQGSLEDPWISLEDHGPAISSGKIIYGENNFGGNHAQILSAHQGADVYIR